MGDPTWAKISRPVLKFLKTGDRSWPDLNTWQKTNRFGATLLRQSLAWLEHEGLAKSVYKPLLNARGAPRNHIFWTATPSP